MLKHFNDAGYQVALAMNCKAISVACFILTSIVSCAQSSYGIRKVDAFFNEHLPGNIRADAEGNPIFQGPDTINSIYIETKGNLVKWIAAWKDGRSFSVTTIAITDTPYEVGVNKQNNKKIILRPATGNKLWLLQLEKERTVSKPPVKAMRGEIILKGKSGKKIIIRRIARQTELDVPPSV